MAKMARKEQAFKLFDEGRKPGDPEIVALGLSRKTVNKYQTFWRKQQSECPSCEGEEEVTAPVASAANMEVPVESIPDGGLFEVNGLLYKKKSQVYSGQVIAARMFSAGYTAILTERGTAEFKPELKVIAK